MKYLTLFMILTIVIVAVSCNRFENTFKPEEVDDGFERLLLDYESSLPVALRIPDIDQIMIFFSEDYLNNGWYKDDVEAYFTELSGIVTENVSVEIISWNYSDLSFSYTITDVDVGIDTLIVEYTAEKDDHYLFIGNQQDQEQPEESRVLVELFTATWCPNCPYVETALFDLKQLYGNKFYYIEYHIMDQLAFGHTDILNYYELSTALPIGIIQGQLKITGGSAANSFDEYNFAISQYFGEDELFSFHEFNYTITEQVMTFNILIEANNTDLTDVQLRYALIEKETDVSNAAGQPCRNVVIAKGNDHLIGNVTTEISFEIPDFTFSDPRLVLWVQTIEEPYNSETCLVHNVIEYEIALP